MSCFCGHSDCPKCICHSLLGVAFEPKKIEKKTISKLTATQAINAIQKRLKDEPASIITREEYDALYNLVIIVKSAQEQLEKAAKPFCDGVKLLNEMI